MNPNTNLFQLEHSGQQKDTRFNQDYESWSIVSKV
jgi:hypothetical protein